MIVQPIGKFKLTYANGISQVVNNSGKLQVYCQTYIR